MKQPRMEVIQDRSWQEICLPNMNTIQYEDFAKIEFRLGQIIEASKVEGSDKLLKFKVDFGEELGIKTVFSGISKYYALEDLLNKKTAFVVNIEPRKIMGEFSEAMIFAAEVEGKISILIPETEMPVGAKIF